MDKQHPFISPEWCPINDVPLVYLNLVQLAAQIVILRRSRRFGEVLKGLKSNMDDHAWASSLDQIELGAQALRHGWQVEFEPRLPSGKKADLRLTNGDDTFLVEMVYRGASVLFQQHDEHSQRVTLHLLQVQLSEGVWFHGDTGPVATDEQLQQWFLLVEQAVAAVKMDGVDRRITGPAGGRIMVSPGSCPPNVEALSGPVLAENHWLKLEARLCDKARQSMGREPVWLWVCDGGGLWQFTDWATWSLEQKLDTLGAMIRDTISAYPHVAGAVVTSGVTWSLRDQAKHQVEAPCGHATRMPFPVGGARETLFVLQAGATDRSQADEFRTWYATEPEYISWLLKTAGYRGLSELFSRD